MRGVRWDDLFYTLFSTLSYQDGWSTETRALLDWLDGVEPIRFPTAGDVERGAEVFDELACGECHSGEAYTDGELHDVGDLLKTPSLLGVSSQGAWRHDSCAETLAERSARLAPTRGTS